MHILVISVATAIARRAMQLKQLDQLGLSGEIMDAVTPKELPISVLDDYRFSWARPLSDGEIACALSHRKVWGIAAKSKGPTLILEDDILLSNDISDVLQAILEGPDLGYISLEFYGQRKTLGKPLALGSTGYGISRLFRDRGGAAAYVVWPKSAQHILDAQTNSLALADAAINLTLGMKFYQLEPACAVQASILTHQYTDVQDYTVTKSILSSASNPRPAYPSRLTYLRCKLRRGYCSAVLLIKVIQAMGRSSTRRIDHKVTPEMIKLSSDA
jgi:glycosyl transferase family 25